MSDKITESDFTTDPGTAGWHVPTGPAGGAVARFATGSFVAGVELIEAIAELAEAANHHPDVDLRFPHVTVRLVSHDVGSLTRRDLDLAWQISEAARELDIPVDRDFDGATE